MYNHKALILLISFWLSPLLHAETATIVSDTSLYQRPSYLSSTIHSLKAGDNVKFIRRSGGWKQIETKQNSSGWVRSYQLRSGTIIVEQKKSSSGGFFSGLANLSRKASGLFSSEKEAYSFQRTATIGVRGLSEEQIKNAKPDLAQLKQMESFHSSKQITRRFAQQGQLLAQKTRHMPASSVEQ